MSTSKKDLLRDLHATYDQRELPDSLKLRLSSRHIVRDSTPVPSTIDEIRNPPTRVRSRQGWSALLAAAAVVAVAVTGTALFKATRAPAVNSSAAETLNVVNSSSFDNHIASVASAVGTPISATRFPGLDLSCNATWTQPEATLGLDVAVKWPPIISSSSSTSLTASVVNSTSNTVEGTLGWYVVILKDGKIVGVLSEMTAMGSLPLEIAPGERIQTAPVIARAVGCESDNVQPLPNGVDYQGIYVQTLGGEFAYSSPVPVFVRS